MFTATSLLDLVAQLHPTPNSLYARDAIWERYLVISAELTFELAFGNNEYTHLRKRLASRLGIILYID